MELNEALHRLVGYHWRLVLACFALGVGFVAVTEIGASQSYTASARIVLGTQDPKSSAESTAIADTAKAIASSPSLVAAALAKVTAAERDPVEVSKHVSVHALGSSGVVEISVSDRSPTVAASITNALVDEVIDTRVKANAGEYRQTLESIDRRIQDLETKITTLAASIDTLLGREQSATSTQVAESFRGQREDLARARDLLAEQRSSLVSTRDSLVTTNALRSTPSIVSEATPPAHEDPSNTLANLALGGFVGLILGIGLAGLLETFRPTIVGGEALARELDTLHLGSLPYNPDRQQPVDHLASIVVRLRLVAEAMERPQVDLLAADGLVEPRYLAEQLNAVAAGAELELADTLELPKREQARASGGSVAATRSTKRAGASARPHSYVQIQSFGLHSPSLKEAGTTGLVLVSPTTLKKTKLDQISRLARTATLPILGLITFTPSRPERSSNADRVPTLPAQAAEERTAKRSTQRTRLARDQSAAAIAETGVTLTKAETIPAKSDTTPAKTGTRSAKATTAKDEPAKERDES